MIPSRNRVVAGMADFGLGINVRTPGNREEISAFKFKGGL
jgi:hypothetical protein